MTDTRYKVLSDVKRITDLVGCGVEFVKGALLLDNSNNKVLAQLKFRNISGKNLKSLYITIKCYDDTGSDLLDGSSFEYAYQDLYVRDKEEFADRTAIYLPDNKIRKIGVSIDKYLLDDGQVVLGNLFKMIELPDEYQNIESKYLSVFEEDISNDLRSNYIKKTYPFKYKEGWICSCEKYNEKHLCTRCGLNRERQFEEITPEKLIKTFNEYLEREKIKEKARIEGERVKNEENEVLRKKKRKRAKKISILALVLVGILFVSNYYIIPNYVIPHSKYVSANKALEDGNFHEARDSFKELGDYKDSQEMISETLERMYIEASNMVEESNYHNAYNLYAELEMDGYKDSSDKAKEVYEFIKTGTFTEDIQITVNADLDAQWVYSVARTERETVDAKLTLEYINGSPNMEEVIIDFVGSTYGGTLGRWGSKNYKYVGEYKNNTITGKGKLYIETLTSDQYSRWKAGTGGLDFTEILLYDGYFDDGAYSGEGTLCWSNDSSSKFVVGTWKNGNISGRYSRYYSDGRLNDTGTVTNGVGFSNQYGRKDYTEQTPLPLP
ncbi:hypothetical protein E9840_12195 [Tissierella creatinini]|nr:hypothetical protein E9840_12195 [Tissierella creatinini]TJX59280.1 hypothetical protein E8P77_21520 [Soehngenia saccharolytica]